MAVTAWWYAKAFISMLDEEIDWVADAIKVALCTDSYVPNQDTHDYWDDVDNEVSGTGYTAGGATLANASIGNTLNVIKLDGDDVAWTNSDITARIAVICDTTPGSSATNPLILWIDFGGDETSSSGTFTIQFHGDGIATITPANAAGYPA